MDKCEVWWNTALDKTNKNPAACQINDECRETCRTAHMISQYRWRPIETELSEWQNFQRLICEPSLRDPIYDRTDKFIQVLSQSKAMEIESENQLLANNYILIIVQLLTGFSLGLELGKIRLKGIGGSGV